MPDRLTAARALKERCYAAWHSDPAELQRCAAALAALAADAPADAVGAEVRALALWTAAITDLAEARLASAVQTLDAAHDAFVAIGHAADAAQTRVPKIMGLALLGRFDAALACAEEAGRALLAQGDRRSAAKVMLNSGSLCMQRDRYREGAQHYRGAAALFARVGDREHSLLAKVGQADALAYLGDTRTAEALYRQAQELARAHGLPVIESAIVQAMAEIALARGRYSEAFSGLEQASREFARLGLPLLRLEADKALADAYLEARMLPEADALYENVLSGLEGQEAAATGAWVWLHRARLKAAANQPALALAALERADRLFAEMGSAAGSAATLLARSEISLCTGAVEAARAAAAAATAQAVAIGLPPNAARLAWAEAEATTHPDQAMERFDGLLADAEATPALHERAWLGRGRLLRRAGRGAEARHAFEQAIELVEAARQRLPGDDFRRSYLEQRCGAYDELLRIELDAHDDARGDAATWAILQAVECRRARTLRERLGPAAAVRERDPEPTEVRARRERLDWLYRRLNRYLREGDAVELPAALHAERNAHERWLLEHHRRAGLTRVMAEAPTAPMPAACDEGALHSGLDHATALVIYAELDGELFALTLVRGRLQLHRRLARFAEVESALRAWRGQLATQQLGSPLLDRHAGLLAERERRCLERLHALVWQPLVATMIGVTAARIVPCGALAGLPFAALWDGQAFVAEHLDLEFAGSVESALQSRPARPIERVFAIADTARLPGAAEEVVALQRCWPGAVVCTGDEATRAAFVGHAGTADLLYLACHGEFRADSPLYSALHLQDGTLTAFDAERLALSAQLVVLSGCETGLADAARDDESLGLARAFLIAGAARVLGGLWAVEDATTGRWMTEFQRLLAAGSTHRRALAETQRSFIARGEKPYVWAAFVLRSAG